MKAYVLVLLASGTFGMVASGAIVDDIGPNTPNGTVNSWGRNDSAGQPIALGGDAAAAYVVSLNAGVWKSVNSAPWVQLQNSPAYAFSIAVDANNASHLAVGERDGDAIDVHRNGSGVWESFDAGNTWSYSFDPLSLPGCFSQAIPALAFSRNGTLFVVGPCGIGRKPAGGSGFDFSRTPDGLGIMRGVATSETKIWARTDSQLLVSVDDGLNWTVINMPSTVGGFPLSFPSRGDVFSLGAFDSGAFMIGMADHTTPCGNTSRLIIYHAATGTWRLQPQLDGSGQPQLGCDGTGLGGRRFVKSYVLNRPDLPLTVGQRLRLFVCNADEVFEAQGLNTDGTIVSWTKVAATRAAGGATIHPDLWDFHFAPDASKAWLVNDGGVYSKAWPSADWTTRNQNLFTHYIYTLNTLETELSLRQRFAYATPDNDAWYYDHLINQWQSVQFLGDANFSAGDTGNESIALMWRSTGPGLAGLTGFSDNLPSGTTLQNITLTPDVQFDGPLFLQFIQTLKNESPTYPLGDAVMLVKLPLHYIDPSGTASATAAVTGDRVTSINVTSGGTGYDLTPNVAISGGGGVNAAATAHLSGGSVTSITVESGGSGYTSTPTVTIDPPYVRVPGPLGQPNPSGAPVLIRNTQFAASPDANSSQFQTWQIVGSDLPLNTRGFWVSGGHSNPVYYAYTINEATGNRLYRRNGSGTGWSLLSVTGLLPGGWHGPAFVNPYNPNRVFVLTSSGIKVSTDGGANFQNDTALTALLTASGKFPLTGTFNGGNGNYVVAGNHGVPMGTLSHMAFDRSQPSRMVAASPFTGVFYDNGSGTWTDLTGLLPKPLAPVSAVGISGPSIYAATQGRGLLRILLDDSSHCFLTGPVLKVGPVDPYHTVRDAYNAVSQDCTTISISAGTYHEAPFPLNKYVRLESRGGAATIGR